MTSLLDGLGDSYGPLLGALFAVGVILAAAAAPLARWSDRLRRADLAPQSSSGFSLSLRFSPLVLVQAVAGLAGLLAAWLATELVGMALLLGGLGVLLPPFVAAPGRRRRQTQEAMAWSQWCQQLAELARAGSGLSQSIQGSLDHAPALTVPTLTKVASAAELRGLDAAFTELFNSGTVWEPEIAAGLKMAAASGSGVADQLLDLSGRIDEAVASHRSKTEAVVQLWAQTIALLALAGGVIALMYINNPSYFEPYDTATGQLVLVGVAGLLLTSISFLVYHSVLREDHSVLVPSRRRQRTQPPL